MEKYTQEKPGDRRVKDTEYPRYYTERQRHRHLDREREKKRENENKPS